MRRTLLALTLCAWAVSPTFAAAPVVADASQVAAEHLEKARKNQPPGFDDFDKIVAQPPGQMLAELRKYMRDPHKEVRDRVLWLAGWVAKKHSAPAVRQQVARLSLDVFLSDPDDYVRSSAIRGLGGGFFQRADFMGQMRQDIHRALSA